MSDYGRQRMEVMSKFQVGDVCEIVRNADPQGQYLIGRECTIVSIGNPTAHCWQMNCSHDCHVTVAGFGSQIWCCHFSCLRKKRPPGDVWADREALGSWDQCPWQPKKERVNAET